MILLLLTTTKQQLICSIINSSCHKWNNYKKVRLYCNTESTSNLRGSEYEERVQDI